MQIIKQLCCKKEPDRTTSIKQVFRGVHGKFHKIKLLSNLVTALRTPSSKTEKSPTKLNSKAEKHLNHYITVEQQVFQAFSDKLTYPFIPMLAPYLEPELEKAIRLLSTALNTECQTKNITTSPKTPNPFLTFFDTLSTQEIRAIAYPFVIGKYKGGELFKPFTSHITALRETIPTDHTLIMEYSNLLVDEDKMTKILHRMLGLYTKECDRDTDLDHFKQQ